MSLTTHIGGRESNSFVSIAEADVIVEKLPDDAAEWEALSPTDKEFRLQLAASAMSHLMWSGRKVYCGQALPFPRTSQGYGNRHVIPQEVKDVQVFLAYSVIHRGLANRPDSVTEADPGSRVSQVSLGGLLSVSFAGSAIEAGTGLDKITRTVNFPAYLKVIRYLTQFRGRSVGSTFTCSTTTTTTTQTTTTVTGTTTTGVPVTTTTVTAPPNPYLPASFSVPTGTLMEGVLDSLNERDQEDVVVREVAGSPGLDLRVTFQDLGTLTPDNLSFFGRYEGSAAHNIKAHIWNFTSAAWENLTSDADDFPLDFSNYEKVIALPTDLTNYVSGGELRVRIYHVHPGDVSHRFYANEIMLT